jgi:hypothetical protein
VYGEHAELYDLIVVQPGFATPFDADGFMEGRGLFLGRRS